MTTYATTDDSHRRLNGDGPHRVDPIRARVGEMIGTRPGTLYVEVDALSDDAAVPRRSEVEIRDLKCPCLSRRGDPVGLSVDVRVNVANIEGA